MNAQQIKSAFKEFAKECPAVTKFFKYLLVVGVIAMETGIIITIS